MTTDGGLTPINLNDTTAQTCNPHAEPPPTPTASTPHVPIRAVAEIYAA